MKFPTYEEMARDVAEKALDEYEYNGKTLREWAEIISAIPVTAIPATDINVGTKVGTNLAEVGTDVPDINVGELISRQAAIDALENDKAALDKIIKGMSAEDMLLKYYVAQHNQVSYDIDAIVQLPPIQPKRGRWIGKYPVTSVCSECGFLIHDSKVKVFAFCPNCGADMRGEQDG